MSAPRQFSDEELTAYLDGEDGLAPREEIERGLAQDPALRARLDALALDKTSIRAAFAALIADAPQSPDLERETVAPSPTRGYQTTWRQAAAAAALALIVGFGGGAVLTGPEEPGWRDYVASYHALYATGTLSHIDQTAADSAAELDRVAAAIKKPISLSDVLMPDQLDYKRAQVLSFEGRALVQLAFLTKQGAPVALCIIEASEPHDSAVATTKLEGMSAAYWSRGGHAFVVIGGEDDAFIGQLAAVYSERL